jgi:hypothetical protein
MKALKTGVIFCPSAGANPRPPDTPRVELDFFLQKWPPTKATSSQLVLLEQMEL